MPALSNPGRNLVKIVRTFVFPKFGDFSFQKQAICDKIFFFFYTYIFMKFRQEEKAQVSQYFIAIFHP
jgi:hypothetical protein